ncbi:MAG: serine/threonine protein kinase [Gemmataceae bacterium]|nr:serine/threonine protein kinase [Gemmataceae bacterium]
MSISPRPQVTTALDPGANPAACLAAALDPSRLPTPPGVALRVAQAAARPDCRPVEIAALLGHDPALCAKILKTVNSCIYGLSRPVASLERAVTVLGLNAVRSLTLGLSISAIRAGGGSDAMMREYWVGSVGGAIIARELATLIRLPCPEDTLVAGLLRDIGVLVLRDVSPDKWEALAARDRDRMVVDPCGAEQEVFGVSHEEVSAELLSRWNLPVEIIEPIRYHHHPDRLAEHRPLAERAVVLSLASSLSMIDLVADLPDELSRVLALADARFGLSGPGLVAFLQGVAPKVDEFARLIDQDIGRCPDFAAILVTATAELENLKAATGGDQPRARGALTPLRRQNRWA